MNLKYFDFFTCGWLDISGQAGASLEYDEASGWVTTNGKYKVYVAQLTQSGTDAPVATVLENTLGFVPNWQRSGSGVYGFDWSGDFFSNKAAIYMSPLYQAKDFYFDYEADYDVTIFSAGNDNYIIKTTFEIRYYN
jgi:hypothetical protein